MRKSKRSQSESKGPIQSKARARRRKATDKPTDSGPSEAVEQQAILRDQRGHFLPGTAAGPGRPPKSKQELNLEELHEIISGPKFQTWVAAIYRDSLKGDADARSLLARFLLPEPKHVHAVEMQARMLSLQAQVPTDDITHLDIPPERLREVFAVYIRNGLVDTVLAAPDQEDRVTDAEILDADDFKESE